MSGKIYLVTDEGPGASGQVIFAGADLDLLMRTVEGVAEKQLAAWQADKDEVWAQYEFNKRWQEEKEEYTGERLFYYQLGPDKYKRAADNEDLMETWYEIKPVSCVLDSMEAVKAYLDNWK